MGSVWNMFSGFPSNSEADASELQGNPEKMFSWYYIVMSVVGSYLQPHKATHMWNGWNRMGRFFLSSKCCFSGFESIFIFF